MNASQYNSCLKKAELTIVGAAPVLGISRRHAQRIAAGDTAVPKPVAKLLRAIVKYDIDPEELD